MLNSQDVSSLVSVSSSSSLASIKSIKSIKSKVDKDRNRPDKITTAYFFDHYATKEDIAVMVTEEDFLAAQRELIPSVSAKELEHYARVRAQFESVGEKDDRKKLENGEEVNGKGKGKANGTAAGGAIPEWQLPRRPKTNGRPKSSGKGKGKGKMKEEIEVEEDEVDGVTQVPAATNGFQVGRAEDDEDLY